MVVIGGGQSGLAAGFYLRRAGLEHVILDDQEQPGGGWRHTWPSLRLFSPAAYSSLPGWQMPAADTDNPDAAHVMDYLTRYERRYDLPVHRPVRVDTVVGETDGYAVRTDRGSWRAPVVISATGTWSQPHWPTVPGQRRFTGRQVHSSRYAGPGAFAGARVVVVGGANSGAQIAADLAGGATVTWCTVSPPRYLPDDVDGWALFAVATRRIHELREGRDTGGVASLGDIVAVPPVRAARDAGRLQPQSMFERMTGTGVTWADGRHTDVDAVIWCTGFWPALRHLRDLGLRDSDGHIPTDGPMVTSHPGLYLVGYGDRTGPASATLIGVGQSVKWAVARIQEYVDLGSPPTTSQCR